MFPSATRIALVALALLALAAPPARAAIIFEVYNNTAAFDARIGGFPRVIDFDDVDTAAADPAPFAANRYKYSHGALIEGEDGQFASTEFDPGSNMPPSSAPNEYAPGPPSDVFDGGGNLTDVHFFNGIRTGLVAGFGVVFIDADFPADGASSLTLFGAGGGQLFTTGTVSGGDGSQLFRGVVAIDDSTDTPVAVIARSHIVSGSGWAGNPDNEAVALDDMRFSFPSAPLGNMGEDCSNCVDDDGDGAIDRFDSECLPQAVGAGGLGDPKGDGKAVLKCQKSTAKAGAKFVATKLKHLQKCAQAVAKCIQQKNGDDACIEKATAKCDKELDKIGTDEQKTVAKIAKDCAAVDMSALTMNDGLGYGAEIKPCAEFGVLNINNATDVGACIVASHECLVERLFVHLVPRAPEYFARVGRNVAAEFPCIGMMGADGGGFGLPDADQAKALLKCDKTLQKIGAGLLKETFKAGQKCADAVATCLQKKPDDPKCMPKAEVKCDKTLLKLTDVEKGKATKLLAKALKDCGSSSLAELGASQGLGLLATQARCTELGYSTSSALGFLRCLGFDHFCEAFHMGEKQVPRLREYSDRLGIDLLELVD